MIYEDFHAAINVIADEDGYSVCVKMVYDDDSKNLTIIGDADTYEHLKAMFDEMSDKLYLDFFNQECRDEASQEYIEDYYEELSDSQKVEILEKTLDELIAEHEALEDDYDDLAQEYDELFDLVVDDDDEGEDETSETTKNELWSSFFDTGSVEDFMKIIDNLIK